MPASTRHHRALAVFVHCLGILAAVPALPTAAPEAAAAPRPAAATPRPAEAVPRPAAPTPRPTAPAPGPTAATHAGVRQPGAAGGGDGRAVPWRERGAHPALGATGDGTAVRAPVSAPPPPVTVAVASESSPAPGTGSRSATWATRRWTPRCARSCRRGRRPTAISGGGQSTPLRRVHGTEVTWRLRLPAHSTTTLGTALAAAAPGRPLTAPACAFTSDGSRPYDCATATWQAARRHRRPRSPRRRRGAGTRCCSAGLGGPAAAQRPLVWVWRRRRGRRVTAAGALATGRRRRTVGAGRSIPVRRLRRRADVGVPRRSGCWWARPSWCWPGVVGTAGWTATRQVPRSTRPEAADQRRVGGHRGHRVGGRAAARVRRSSSPSTG